MNSSTKNNTTNPAQTTSANNIFKAGNTMLALLVVIIVFHLFIIAKIIPYRIAWGGRLQSDSQMYLFETVSVLINLFLIFILLIKTRYIKQYLSLKATNIILYIFMILFALNTVGNLFAKTSLEKTFAFITLLFSILIYKIVKTK